jgi:hypothetical protein
MKFTKVVFWIAGVWGVLVLTPLYFLFDEIGRRVPPAITHPQYYYGFVGVALVWQFVFFVIATDPLRFRPLIGLSVLEKLSFILAVTVLALEGRLRATEWTAAVPDTILAVFFLIALVKTRSIGREKT